MHASIRDHLSTVRAPSSPPQRARMAAGAPATPTPKVPGSGVGARDRKAYGLRDGKGPQLTRMEEVTAMDTTTGGVAEVRHEKPVRQQRSPQGGPAAGGGAVYGLGMIGALVYFVGSATSGSDYALAIPKALFWPAVLVYRLLQDLDR